MKTIICICMLGVLALGASPVWAGIPPGPFPWGMGMTEMLADVPSDFEPEVKGDVLYINTGYGFGGASRGIISFGENGLTQVRYEVRPATNEGEKFIEQREFLKLFDKLKKQYGEPLVEKADAETFHWANDTETVVLAAHGGGGTLMFVELTYTAREAALFSEEFDYLYLPGWRQNMDEVRAAWPADSASRIKGDALILDIGRDSTAVMRFEDDGLAQVRYEIRPLETGEFVAPLLLDRLLARLTAQYGRPIPTPVVKEHPDAETYYWETNTETVQLVAHGGRNTLGLLVLVYTAQKDESPEMAFDYLYLPVWGQSLDEVRAQLSGDFTPQFEGETMYLDIGHGFGGNSKAIISFDCNKLVQVCYEVRSLETEEFIAAVQFDKLLAWLKKRYGEPVPKPEAKEYPGVETYCWEHPAETVQLVAHGGRNTLGLLVLVYTTKKVALHPAEFDYVNSPDWGTARVDVMALLLDKQALKNDEHYMAYALGRVDGVPAELQLTFVDNALRAASIIFNTADLDDSWPLYNIVRERLVERYGEPADDNVWYLPPPAGDIYLRKEGNVLSIDSIDTGYFEYRDGDYYPRVAVMPIYDPPPWGVSPAKIKERMADAKLLETGNDYLIYDIGERENLPVLQKFYFTGAGKLYSMRVNFDIDDVDEARRLAVYGNIIAGMAAKYGAPQYDFDPGEAQNAVENPWGITVDGYWHRHTIWETGELFVYVELIDDAPEKVIELDYTALEYLQYF